MAISCPAILSTGAAGEPLCLDEEMTPVAWTDAGTDWTGEFDPFVAGQAFMVPFVLLGSLALLGAAVRAVLRTLK